MIASLYKTRHGALRNKPFKSKVEDKLLDVCLAKKPNHSNLKSNTICNGEGKKGKVKYIFCVTLYIYIRIVSSYPLFNRDADELGFFQAKAGQKSSVLYGPCCSGQKAHKPV